MCVEGTYHACTQTSLRLVEPTKEASRGLDDSESQACKKDIDSRSEVKNKNWE